MKKILMLSAVLAFIAALILNIQIIINAAKDVVQWVRPEPTPPRITDMVGPIQVLDIKTKDRPEGMYFHFAANDLDAALRRNDWDHKKFVVKRQRDGRSGKARIWRRNGTGQGRFDEKDPKTDWQIGDSFLIYPESRGTH